MTPKSVHGSTSPSYDLDADVDSFLAGVGQTMTVQWDKLRPTPEPPLPPPPPVSGATGSCSWDDLHEGPAEGDASWAAFDAMAPVDTSRKVVASNRRLSKEEREKLKDEQQLAEARESIRKRGWSEAEVKWRSWLATRGHDVQVNDWNLHKYVEGECTPPSRDPWFLNAHDRPVPDYEAGNDGEDEEDAPAVTNILSEPIAPAWRYPQPRELKPLWCDVDEVALLAHGLGRRTEAYYWRQTTSTVQLELKLPPGTSARELRVSMQPTRITVRVGSDPEPLLDEELYMKIYVGSNTDDDCSIWEVQDKRVLVFHLVKWHRLAAGNVRDASKTWWCKCLNSEEAFDLKVPHAEYYNEKEK